MNYETIDETINSLEVQIRWIEEIPEHHFTGWYATVLAMRDAQEKLERVKEIINE